MSNNKKSSVDWLNDELASLNFDYLTGQIDNKKYNERHKEIIEQAKAMHKDETLTAMNIAFRDGLYMADESYGESYKSSYVDWEDYYNETFGGNK